MGRHNYQDDVEREEGSLLATQVKAAVWTHNDCFDKIGYSPLQFVT